MKFKNKSGATPEEVLNNLDFSIPVSSLFSKNDVRDEKLKVSFFGIMANTDLIRGTIKHVDNKYMATLTMNGVTENLPLEVIISEDKKVSMKAEMNLKNWDALTALEILNKACFDLHKGADGISKTWSEVGISAAVYLKKE